MCIAVKVQWKHVKKAKLRNTSLFFHAILAESNSFVKITPNKYFGN